jgi:hypothetical protein
MAKSPPQPTRVLRSGKAHCQSSPTKASARNGIKKPRAKVISKRKITPGREFKYFLDLPHEIRHQIYLHFVQWTESNDALEVVAIKKRGGHYYLSAIKSTKNSALCSIAIVPSLSML